MCRQLSLQEYTMSNAVPLRTSMHCLHILQSHYPERLGGFGLNEMGRDGWGWDGTEFAGVGCNETGWGWNGDGQSGAGTGQHQPIWSGLGEQL